MADPADPLAAAISDRNEDYIATLALTEATVAQMPSGDLRRLLAAVEGVLKLHEPDQYGCQICAGACPEVAAITAALLGKEATDGN
jgi:hypothetical protein